MREIANKAAVVTGGGSGIGLGMVEALLEAGARVAILDFNDRHLAEVRERFAGNNQVAFVRVDVTDRNALRTAADEVVGHFGRIHILCNNAGIAGGNAPEDPDFDTWDRMMRVNLGGAVNVVKTFVPIIRAQGEGGHVVNTSSMAGIVPLPDEGGAYTVAKFAIRGMSEAMRLNLPREGIGVSCLFPGLTRSRIMQVEPESGGKPLAGEGNPDALFNSMDGAMEAIDLGRIVVQAIRDNRFYILAHPEFRDEVVAMQQELLDGFSYEQPVSPERAAFEKWRWSMSEERRRKPVD